MLTLNLTNEQKTSSDKRLDVFSSSVNSLCMIMSFIIPAETISQNVYTKWQFNVCHDK